MDGWQLAHGDTGPELAERIESAARAWYTRCFGDSGAANHRLPTQVRGLAATEGWWLGYLLTPWMLARICLPQAAPPLALPSGWTADARGDAPCIAIGPLLPLEIPTLLGGAHLQYLPELGHFLLQPLVQNLNAYPDAGAVFGAWQGVVDKRAAIRAERERQAQVDRRAFLRRMIGGA